MVSCASEYTYIRRKAPLLFGAKKKDEAMDDSLPENETDTNVISLDFKALPTAMEHIFMGDPFFCKKCSATLSLLSKDKIHNKETYSQIVNNKSKPDKDMIIEEKPEEENMKSMVLSKKDMEEEKGAEANDSAQSWTIHDLKPHESVWICEFCGYHNRIAIETEELPKTNDLFYLLQSATQQKTAGETPKEEDISIIFCIDFSGSMCVTTEIKVKDELKQPVSQEEWDTLKDFIEDNAPQFLPNQNKDIQWISRKQCVLAAIENQIQEIKKTHPHRKIGVVAFNNEVIIYGDDAEDPIVVAGDKLDKKDTCLDIGVESYHKIFSRSVLETGDKLIKKLESLKENGKTALGPALAISLGLASQGKPGSTVILCTDGLANIGIGELDSSKAANDTFYEDMGVYAKERGILVNVITIKGEGAKIEKLGQISDLTQGKVIRVNPDKITEDFASVMKDVVIGTQVEVKIRLHPTLKFRNEEEQYLAENKSVYQKNIGNVTARTALTFEYQNKIDIELQQQGIVLDELKEVPLQVNITYMSPEGNKILRIITKKQLLTDDLNVAEKDLKFKVLATRATQITSTLASKGNLKGAMESNQKWDQYLSRKVDGKSETAKKSIDIWKTKHTSMNEVIGSRASRKLKADSPSTNVVNFGGMNQNASYKPEQNDLSTQNFSNPLADEFPVPEQKQSYFKADINIAPCEEKISKKEVLEDAEASDDENAEIFQNKQVNCDDFE